MIFYSRELLLGGKYPSGFVVFEQTNQTERTSVTKEIILKNSQRYKITLVGGGGGSNATHIGDEWYRATGSSGAVVRAIFNLKKTGVRLKIQTGGYGYSFYKPYASGYPYDERCNGIDSFIQIEDELIAFAQGGRSPNEAGGTPSNYSYKNLDYLVYEDTSGSKRGYEGSAAYAGFTQPTAEPALSAYDDTPTGYGAGAGIGYDYYKQAYGGFVKIESI